MICTAMRGDLGGRDTVGFPTVATALSAADGRP
jgi:hypothetical protein